MAYRLRLIFLPLLFISLHVNAIQAVVSHTVFYMPDSAGNAKKDKPYLEIYWQFDPHTLHYMTNEKQELFAKIKTDIIFSNRQGIVGEAHFILETDHFTSQQDVLAHSIIDMHRYVLPPGEITMQLNLTDATDSNNRFEHTDSFAIAAPRVDSPFYSGIQLLDTAYVSNVRTIFQKNNFQQIPLCANFYDENRNKLRYYFELYGTDKISNDYYPLIEHVFISRKVKAEVIPKLVKTDTITSMGFQYSLGSFPIETLGSGNYYVNVTLENNLRVVLASSSMLFQRFNPNPAKEDTVSDKLAATVEDVTILNLGKTFIAKFSEQQVKLILKMLLPFADPDQTQTIQAFLKGSDDGYSRYFIYNYFAAINKNDPALAWKEFADKIRAVNRMFSIGGEYDKKGKMIKGFTTPGYITDRGFIYLRYGKPTEEIDVENEDGAYPYQIWQYNTLTERNKKKVSNAVFLFYRPSEMVADYQLLHSTVAGEVQNKGWRSFLYTNSGGGTNPDSRAEQYLGNR